MRKKPELEEKEQQWRKRIGRGVSLGVIWWQWQKEQLRWHFLFGGWREWHWQQRSMVPSGQGGSSPHLQLAIEVFTKRKQRGKCKGGKKATPTCRPRRYQTMVRAGSRGVCVRPLRPHERSSSSLRGARGCTGCSLLFLFRWRWWRLLGLRRHCQMQPRRRKQVHSGRSLQWQWDNEAAANMGWAEEKNGSTRQKRGWKQ